LLPADSMKAELTSNSTRKWADRLY